MRPTLLRPQPPRQLAELGRPAGVLATGAIGYLDAAEDDRRRWIAGLRSLLDGLNAPLQVLIDFVPGTGDAQPHSPALTESLPATPVRRELDLAFAQTLRDSRSTQRRDVHLVADPSAIETLERALRELGVPDVRQINWQPPAGLLFGKETPSRVQDCQGWHRTWWLERFPGVELMPGWLLRLVPDGLRLTLSWHAERLPTAWVVDYLQRQLVNMRAAQMHSAGGVGDPQIEGAAPAAEALQQRLTASQESAFHVSLYLTLCTPSAEELEAATVRVEAAGRSALCQLLPATFRQLDGRLSTLPLARDPLGRRRVLDTSALVTMFPWFDADLQEPAGLVIGASRATGQPVMIDPFDDRRYANAKAFVSQYVIPSGTRSILEHVDQLLLSRVGPEVELKDAGGGSSGAAGFSSRTRSMRRCRVGPR